MLQGCLGGVDCKGYASGPCRLNAEMIWSQVSIATVPCASAEAGFQFELGCAGRRMSMLAKSLRSPILHSLANKMDRLN